MYFYGMPIKRDRVNRVTGLVYLPIDGSRLYRGQHIELSEVTENPINCLIRDTHIMDEPKNGNAIGDAVFDAQTVGDEWDYTDPEHPVFFGNACDAGAMDMEQILIAEDKENDETRIRLISANGKRIVIKGLDESKPHITLRDWIEIHNYGRTTGNGMSSNTAHNSGRNTYNGNIDEIVAAVLEELFKYGTVRIADLKQVPEDATMHTPNMGNQEKLAVDDKGGETRNVSMGAMRNEMEQPVLRMQEGGIHILQFKRNRNLNTPDRD